MFFDPLYLILTLPVLLFSMYAQHKVKSSFNKYSKIKANSRITGREVAEIILKKNGINNVSVAQTSGWLSDHYSPTEKVLRLSQGVYDSQSISALGVAAHEAGHAIQHAKGIAVMKLWLFFAKPAAFAGNIAIWLIIIGSIINFMGLALLGFLLFGAVVVFQIITLPLEFDASNRAKKFLKENKVVSDIEYAGVRSVLDSAALTYVAAAAASIVQLLYYAIRLGLLGNRNKD